MECEESPHKLANTYVGLKHCSLLVRGQEVLRTTSTPGEVLSPVDTQDVKQSGVSLVISTCARTHTHHQPLASTARLLKVDPFLLTEEELRDGEAVGVLEGGQCWTPTKSDIAEYSTCSMNTQGH